MPQIFDVVSSSERYPYLIDRNLQIFSNNELYLNVPMQMINIVKDSLDLVRYRKKMTNQGDLVSAR